MQTTSAFRRASRGHASSKVSRLSSAAAGLRLQGLLPGDDLGRDVLGRFASCGWTTWVLLDGPSHRIRTKGSRGRFASCGCRNPA